MFVNSDIVFWVHLGVLLLKSEAVSIIFSPIYRENVIYVILDCDRSHMNKYDLRLVF